MEEGGYSNNSLWSDAGWNWCMKKSIVQPQHWDKDRSGHCYGHTVEGPYDLDPATPVYGINHFEASAYANWAGARLAHEYEWEIARQLGVLDDCGQVWEWCLNGFHPYEGFTAFPYIGYSTPYFDGKHFCLRGGSRYSQAVIKRHTFRNYYQADKRHILAGMRLVYE